MIAEFLYQLTAKDAQTAPVLQRGGFRVSAAAANVTVIAMPVGASFEDAWKKMSETSAARYIVIRVLESNWDAGGLSGNLSYKYEFGIHIAGPGEFKQLSKHFSAQEANPASQKYNVWDMHSVRYRQIFESMFSDPMVRAALQN